MAARGRVTCRARWLRRSDVRFRTPPPISTLSTSATRFPSTRGRARKRRCSFPISSDISSSPAMPTSRRCLRTGARFRRRTRRRRCGRCARKAGASCGTAASPPIPDCRRAIPPDHTRIRKLVQGCFGPRRFRSIEPQIRQIVEPRDRRLCRTRPCRFLSRIRLRRSGTGAVQAGRCARRRRAEGQVLGGEPLLADLGQSDRRRATAARPQHGRVLELLPRTRARPPWRSDRRPARRPRALAARRGRNQRRRDRRRPLQRAVRRP